MAKTPCAIAQPTLNSAANRHAAVASASVGVNIANASGTLDVISLLRFVLLLLGLLLPAPGFAQEYSIGWYKIAGGGGASTGGVYSVNGTIGQVDAGAMSGDAYTLAGGFWSVLASAQAAGSPPLTIQLTATNTVVVSWPTTADNWLLQESTTGASGTWSNVSVPPVLVGGTMQVSLPASEGNNHFRLVPAPTAPELWITGGPTNTLMISWSALWTRWMLQESPAPAAGSWDSVTNAPVQVGDCLQVTLTMSTGSRFYRLAQVPQLMMAGGEAHSVVLSWTAPATGWVLQENSTLAPNTWTNCTTTPLQIGSRLQVTVSAPLGNRFYRLKK